MVSKVPFLLLTHHAYNVLHLISKEDTRGTVSCDVCKNPAAQRTPEPQLFHSTALNPSELGFEGRGSNHRMTGLAGSTIHDILTYSQHK